MEALLQILGDLAVLSSIALVLWGMVLCAMLGFGEGSHERPAGQRRGAFRDRLVRGSSGPRAASPPVEP